MTGFDSKRQAAMDKTMTRPVESDYTSQVAYTRALEAYCDTLAQPEQPAQEPVEVCCGDYHKCSKPCTPRGRYYGEKLAPQRPWVGLTAQEAADCWTTSATKTWHNFESKLKEKNT